MKAILKLTLGALLASTGLASADTLDKITAAGKIVVGVKNDYRPWGYLDASGNIVGLEIDLAKDIASRLGVEVELVPVVASNRMEFLQQGRIDLIIATLGDNPQRREVVGMVEPNYYAGGANVLAPKANGLKEWTDLEGKDLCAIQGSYYIRETTQKYKTNILAFAGVPEATAALTNGSCVGLIYDNPGSRASWPPRRSGPITRCPLSPSSCSPGQLPCRLQNWTAPMARRSARSSPTGTRPAS
ncbi:transporter substrate-binding domain-containing protein [Pseudogemmobacter bohemicus]|uniref:transporter substrate-binding domain-containing protein n=1 Tax=Pseudogemmobacter bohemicus TaxID=2250708 RepID=UPI001E2D4E89|nr:transporter substrate-binding domain-containing protein [Pseudogemmobacter bohemicus]